MNRTRHPCRPARRFGRRARGAAAVELALCLPVLLAITWMTIVACEMIHLRHSLTLAAYEGARTAIVKGATNQQVTDAAEWVLDTRGVKSYTVTPAPAGAAAGDISTVDPGQFIEVTAAAEINPNMALMGFTDGSLQVTSEMMKEY